MTIMANGKDCKTEEYYLGVDYQLCKWTLLFLSYLISVCFQTAVITHPIALLIFYYSYGPHQWRKVHVKLGQEIISWEAKSRCEIKLQAVKVRKHEWDWEIVHWHKNGLDLQKEVETERYGEEVYSSTPFPDEFHLRPNNVKFLLWGAVVFMRAIMLELGSNNLGYLQQRELWLEKS